MAWRIGAGKNRRRTILIGVLAILVLGYGIPIAVQLISLLSESQPVRAIYLEDFRFGSAAFLPTSSQLFVTDGKGAAFVWDVVTGERVKSMQTGLSGPADMLVESVDGHVILADQAGRVEKWNPETGERLLRLDRTDGVPNDSVRLLPDGKRIILAGTRGVLWDFSGNSADRGLPVYERIRDDFRYMRSSIARDSSLVATSVAERVRRGYQTRAVMVWDADTGQLKTTYHRWGNRFAVLSPDGKQLALGAHHDRIEFWNVETERRLHRLETGQAFNCIWGEPVFSPNGPIVAVPRTVIVNLQDEQRSIVHRFQEPIRVSAQWFADRLQGRNHARLADAGTGIQKDVSLHLYDTRTWELVGEIEAERGSVNLVSSEIGFSPDGNRLYSAAYADPGVSALKVWDVGDLTGAQRGEPLEQ